MPKANLKKIKSALSPYLIAAVIALLCLGGVAGYLLLRAGGSHQNGSAPTTKLMIPNGTRGPARTYTLETVSTAADQARGLSGRRGLDASTGMLFSYPNVAERCIWMKDMRFNIDIIWLDDTNRVSSIVADLSPKSYPQNYCADAKYVVELPAGAAAEQGLRVGQVVKLE